MDKKQPETELKARTLPPFVEVLAEAAMQLMQEKVLSLGLKRAKDKYDYVDEALRQWR